MKTTLHVPMDVYKAVQHEKVEMAVNAQDIFTAAVREYLKLPLAQRQQILGISVAQSKK